MGQFARVMQTVLHLTPPPTDVRLLSKTEKTSRNRKILPTTERNLEKSKKKQPKDSRTMCWYHVNSLLARLFVLVFFRFLEGSFGFGQNLSISQCFLILDRFFQFPDVFSDFGHLLLISRCFLLIRYAQQEAAKIRQSAAKASTQDSFARKSLEGFPKTSNKKTKGVASPTTQLQVTASPTESLASSQLAPSPSPASLEKKRSFLEHQSSKPRR